MRDTPDVDDDAAGPHHIYVSARDADTWRRAVRYAERHRLRTSVVVMLALAAWLDDHEDDEESE